MEPLNDGLLYHFTDTLGRGNYHQALLGYPYNTSQVQYYTSFTVRLTPSKCGFVQFSFCEFPSIHNQLKLCNGLFSNIISHGGTLIWRQVFALTLRLGWLWYILSIHRCEWTGLCDRSQATRLAGSICWATSKWRECLPPFVGQVAHFIIH